MTKYYCDMCGQEVGRIEKFILSTLKIQMFAMDMVYSKNIFVYNPEHMELCNNCKNDVGVLIYYYKGAN